jgi:hypothetical protein
MVYDNDGPIYSSLMGTQPVYCICYPSDGPCGRSPVCYASETERDDCQNNNNCPPGKEKTCLAVSCDY